QDGARPATGAAGSVKSPGMPGPDTASATPGKPRTAPAPPLSPVDPARRKLNDPVTRSQGIAELEHIIASDKGCRTEDCIKSHVLLAGAYFSEGQAESAL